MTKLSSTILLGWCQDNSCGEPIRGVVGQQCPKFCLPCAVRRATGVKEQQQHIGDPNELIFGGADYRELRDTSDEDNQD